MTEKAKPVKCKVDGCKNDAATRELCPKHYQRFRQHGDAAAPSLRQKLSNRDVANIRQVKDYRGINGELARKYGVTESTISSIRRGDRRAKK